MTLKETALAQAAQVGAQRKTPPSAPPAAAAKPEAKSSFPEPEHAFFGHSRKARTPIAITLQNGVTVEGIVTAWGHYTVAIEPTGSEGRNRLIYKNAIAYVEFPQVQGAAGEAG
jgi:RNA chaperone Hfq